MKKINLLIMLLLLIPIALAHGAEDFSAAEEIIKQKIPCENLNEEQLEILGDYYMEQMHPGGLHEIMDERMGGEGSESLRETHIRIAEAFYCGEHELLGSGMMDVMMGRADFDRNYMMRNNNYNPRSYVPFWVLYTLIIILVVVLIIVLINNKKRRR